jgi:hypothetical protein
VNRIASHAITAVMNQAMPMKKSTRHYHDIVRVISFSYARSLVCTMRPAIAR